MQAAEACVRYLALRILTNCPEFETAEKKQKDKI